MIIKNALYGFALFMRFRGLSKLGGFQGSLLAASQPLLVGVLSMLILGEHLLNRQWLAMILICGALVLPINFEKGKWQDIFHFAIGPAIRLSLVIVIDRWILVNSLSPMAFFVLDKVVLLPVVAATLILSGKFQVSWPRGKFQKAPMLFWTIVLGLTWALASYTYGLSLAGEKTALVTLIRNLAFPASALGSALLFKENLNRSKILNLALAISAFAIAI